MVDFDDHSHPVTGDITRDMLIERVAQLWDQVWWHSLPWWRRLYYRLQGFEAPIRMFGWHSEFYGARAFGRRP
jgi:hypothetical protein